LQKKKLKNDRNQYTFQKRNRSIRTVAKYLWAGMD
jgi:hypothetical protein